MMASDWCEEPGLQSNIEHTWLEALGISYLNFLNVLTTVHSGSTVKVQASFEVAFPSPVTTPAQDQ